MRTDILERLELTGIIATPDEVDATRDELQKAVAILADSLTFDDDVRIDEAWLVQKGELEDGTPVPAGSVACRILVTDYALLKSFENSPDAVDAWLGRLGSLALPLLVEAVRKSAPVPAAVDVEPDEDATDVDAPVDLAPLLAYPESERNAAFQVTALSEIRKLARAIAGRPAHVVNVQPSVNHVHVDPTPVTNNITVEARKPVAMLARNTREGRVYEPVEDDVTA